MRPPAQAAAGIALREAMRTRAFWLQWGAIFACSVGLFIPFVHLVPYARDAGHPETTAVFLVSLIGVGSMVGRFGFAGLADRIERRALHAVVYAGMAAMLGLWLASTGAVALGLFAVLFGAFYGAFVALQPPLAMDLYGARNVSGVIGVLYTAAGSATCSGPGSPASPTTSRAATRRRSWRASRSCSSRPASRCCSAAPVYLKLVPSGRRWAGPPRPPRRASPRRFQRRDDRDRIATSRHRFTHAMIHPR